MFRVAPCALVLACTLVVVTPTSASSLTFDTLDAVPIDAEFPNAWPWGAVENYRYQLYLHENILAGLSGPIQSIVHFSTGTDGAGFPHFQHDPITYQFTVLISVTDVTPENLSTDFSANHSSQPQTVFTGSLVFDSLDSLQFVIELDQPFHYTGSGNLLIDYAIDDADPLPPTSGGYPGPWFEAHVENDEIYRVTGNHLEGEIVHDWGGLRTQLILVPEPGSAALLAACSLGLLRRHRRLTATAGV